MAPSRHTARDARAPGWFWSDNDLIDHYGPIIGAYGVAVYCALARYADRDGRAFPSYERLAKQLSISRRTVIRTIAVLIEQKLVESEARTKPNGDPDSNCYVLIPIARQSQERAVPSDSQTLPSDSQTLGVVTHSHLGSDSQSPKEDSWNKTQPPPPPNPPAPAARAGGGGGFEQPTETQVALLTFGFNAKSAARFRDLPLDVVQAELRAARARGSGAGSLVEAWKVSPPTVPRPPDAPPNLPPAYYAAPPPPRVKRKLPEEHHATADKP